MVTRTGDATAELIALLREHCPDCAEDTLARLAEGVVGSALAAGDQQAADALRWTRLTLGSIPGVEQFVSVVEPPVQAVSTVLRAISGILDVLSSLLIDITDPFRALIMAAYEILKSIVDDLLASGAYLYLDAPGLLSNQAALVNLGMPEPDLPRWLAGDRPPKPVAPADGFTAWAARFRQSFDDAGDDQRPQFSDGAPVEAVFIVGTAPQLPDLARLGSLFTALLDLGAFAKAFDDFAASFPEWPDDPDRARLRSRSVAPDWRAWRLRDIGPDEYPLRQLEKIPEALKALLVNGDSVVALLKALIAAIQDKVALLQEMVAIIQQVIDMLKALSATGLHVLPVATNGGVDGLVEAFLSATNRPNTDAEGQPTGANAIIGVCLLAGGSEIDPAAVLPVWALLGQEGSMDRAFGGLSDDLDALEDAGRAALDDAAAAASQAWNGVENGGDTPRDRGLADLLGEAGDELSEQGRALHRALGMDRAEADERARSDRTSLVRALDGARAAGLALDPVALAHVEATRRAQRRGARSLAMSMGPRQPAADAPTGGPQT